MNRPFNLYRLQQLDSQLDRMTARLQQIDDLLANDADVQSAKDNLDSSSLYLTQKKKELQKAEDNLQIQKVKIEQAEASLYGGKIRNPKELQDLQNEVAALRRYQTTLEDRLLDSMQAEEDATVMFENAKNAYENYLGIYKILSLDLNSEREKIKKDYSQSEFERSAIMGSIAEEDLALYQALRKQRRGIAVAVITDKACSACGTVLNAMLLHSARSPEQISRCDSCGRILYLA